MTDSLMPGRPLRILALLGCVVMIAMLVYAMSYGYAWQQVRAIGSIHWGQVVFVDLYLGFALFSAWIVWRQNVSAVAIAWIVALLLLGNLLACIYVLWALREAGSDGQRFWHGRRAQRPEPAAPNT
ncbi:MAG: hypothetical protein V5A42_04230 [Halofilum sp. (in: g-proteobacteria)]